MNFVLFISKNNITIAYERIRLSLHLLQVINNLHRDDIDCISCFLHIKLSLVFQWCIFVWYSYQMISNHIHVWLFKVQTWKHMFNRYYNYFTFNNRYKLQNFYLQKMRKFAMWATGGSGNRKNLAVVQGCPVMVNLGFNSF